MYIGNIKRHDLSRFPKLVSLSLSLSLTNIPYES